MKTLAKIIMRLIFGHPLSEIEARQKRENEKAVKAILAEEDTRTKQAWDIIHKHARYYIGRMKVYQYGRQCRRLICSKRKVRCPILPQIMPQALNKITCPTCEKFRSEDRTCLDKFMPKEISQIPEDIDSPYWCPLIEGE